MTTTITNLTRVNPSGRVVDSRAGIGGTARLIAAEPGARVTAGELAPECLIEHRAGLIDAVLTTEGR